MAKDRAEKTEETRNTILDTAARLFAQNGYAGTSMREIGEAAGFTKPTLYYHFSSKEGLCKALIEIGVEEFRRGATEILGRRVPVLEKIRLFARLSYQNVHRYRDYVVFYMDFFSGPDVAGVRDEYINIFFEAEAGLPDLIRLGQQSGELRPEISPEIAAAALHGALTHHLLMHVRTGKPELTDELADSLVDIVIRGLAVR